MPMSPWYFDEEYIEEEDGRGGDVLTIEAADHRISHMPLIDSMFQKTRDEHVVANRVAITTTHFNNEDYSLDQEHVVLLGVGQEERDPDDRHHVFGHAETHAYLRPREARELAKALNTWAAVAEKRNREQVSNRE